MTSHPIAEPLLEAEALLGGFDNLMPFKVQNILLSPTPGRGYYFAYLHKLS